jgi:hypothetical protein
MDAGIASLDLLLLGHLNSGKQQFCESPGKMLLPCQFLLGFSCW